MGPIITVYFPTVAILNGNLDVYLISLHTVYMCVYGPTSWFTHLLDPFLVEQTRRSSSLSLTLVSLRSLESCVCLGLTWMHTLDVLDDGLSQSNHDTSQSWPSHGRMGATWESPLDCLACGGHNLFSLSVLWHSPPLNLVIILNKILSVTIILLIITPSNNFVWLCLFRLNK